MKENSIKEDIERLKQRIEDVKEYIEYGLPYSEYLDLENSFDNILSDYKRVLKENEELKAKWDKDTHILQNELDLTNADKINNYIPVQKVKDKIKKNEEIIDISDDVDTIHELYQENTIYEKLLESEE